MHMCMSRYHASLNDLSSAVMEDLEEIRRNLISNPRHYLDDDDDDADGESSSLQAAVQSQCVADVVRTLATRGREVTASDVDALLAAVSLPQTSVALLVLSCLRHSIDTQTAQKALTRALECMPSPAPVVHALLTPQPGDGFGPIKVHMGIVHAFAKKGDTQLVMQGLGRLEAAPTPEEIGHLYRVCLFGDPPLPQPQPHLGMLATIVKVYGTGPPGSSPAPLAMPVPLAVFKDAITCPGYPSTALDLLIASGLVDFVADPAGTDQAFRAACRYATVGTVQALLRTPGVDPAASHSIALACAVASGDVGKVAALLQDGRVVPSAGGSLAVCLAARHGPEEILDLLLQADEGPLAVDPNECVRFLTRTSLLQVLLRGPCCKVDFVALARHVVTATRPADDAVAKLWVLLDDPRVDAQVISDAMDLDLDTCWALAAHPRTPIAALLVVAISSSNTTMVDAILSDGPSSAGSGCESGSGSASLSQSRFMDVLCWAMETGVVTANNPTLPLLLAHCQRLDFGAEEASVPGIRTTRVMRAALHKRDPDLVRAVLACPWVPLTPPGGDQAAVGAEWLQDIVTSGDVGTVQVLLEDPLQRFNPALLHDKPRRAWLWSYMWAATTWADGDDGTHGPDGEDDPERVDETTGTDAADPVSMAALLLADARTIVTREVLDWNLEQAALQHAPRTFKVFLDHPWCDPDPDLLPVAMRAGPTITQLLLAHPSFCEGTGDRGRPANHWWRSPSLLGSSPSQTSLRDVMYGALCMQNPTRMLQDALESPWLCPGLVQPLLDSGRVPPQDIVGLLKHASPGPDTLDRLLFVVGYEEGL